MYSSQATTQELPDTQDVCTSEDQVTDDKSWGRLISTKNSIPVIELTELSYSFGRGPDIPKQHRFIVDDYGESLCGALSKLHFRITKLEEEDNIVFLEDLSSNGTFINKTLVGKKKKVALKSNDEISLAHPDKKVFIFYDCIDNDAEEYPASLREKYTMTKSLGSGSYGEVRLAFCKDSMQKYAVKILKKTLSRAGSTMYLMNLSQLQQNETDLLCSVDHPCIVKLVELFESPDKLYMVMELAEGGELFDRITNKKLTEQLAKLYFYQLLLALQYLHSKRITHRDLKPENILLSTDDDETCIKLTDFGFSKMTADCSQMTTICGTPTYIPPELLMNYSYSNKVDMWSLGVVLYVSLAGYIPFYGADAQMKENIKRANYNFDNIVWSNASDNVKDLITKLLVVDPNRRLSADEALDHPWFDDKKMKEKAALLMIVKKPTGRKRPIPLDDDDGDTIIQNSKTPCILNNDRKFQQ